MAKKVGSVLLEKVSAATVDQYLEKYGLPSDGEIEDRVARLAAHQLRVGKAHQADCDNCQGTCDVREPVCVYCGVGDDEGQVAQAVAKNPQATIEPKAAPAKAPKKRSESAAPPVVTTTGKGTKPIHVDPGADVQVVSKSEGPAQVTLAALDANVHEIQALRRDAVVSY